MSLTDNISDVFARCPYFVIAEVEKGEVKGMDVVENRIAGQLGQAGISVAQSIAEKEVGVVITNNVGPRALDVLKQFKIDIYAGHGPVEEVLRDFIAGKLEKNRLI